MGVVDMVTVRHGHVTASWPVTVIVAGVLVVFCHGETSPAFTAQRRCARTVAAAARGGEMLNIIASPGRCRPWPMVPGSAVDVARWRRRPATACLPSC